MNPEFERTTLGEIAESEGYGLVDGPFGSNLPASSYTESGVPVIRGSNLSLGVERFNSDEFVYVSEETADRLQRSLCRPWDIVFTKKGTLGQTVLVPDDGPNNVYLLSSNQMKLTVDRKVADPLFVYYYVSSPASTAKIKRDSEATGVPKTNIAYLRDFPIALPPLSEQRRIASILGSLDDKIEHNRRAAQSLERLARAIFKAWFVDFEPVKAKAEGATYFPSMPQDVFDGLPTTFVDTEIGPVPEGWGSGKLGDLLYEHRDTVKPSDLDDDVPYIGLEHMPKRSIRLAEWGQVGAVLAVKCTFERATFSSENCDHTSIRWASHLWTESALPIS